MESESSCDKFLKSLDDDSIVKIPIVENGVFYMACMREKIFYIDYLKYDIVLNYKKKMLIKKLLIL